MSTSTKSQSLKRTKKRAAAAVVIMGAGKLGEALLSLGTFPGREFRVVAIFDVDPKQVGKRFPRSLVVEPTVQLASRVSTHNVQRGIIAVPSSTAQQAADALVSAGVKVILNYASADLRVPFGVIVSRVPDPAAQFAKLMSSTTPPLPWKMPNPTITTTASTMGLARMPQMWTESTHWGLSNPILQSVVGGQVSSVVAVACAIKQEGFFEYTQRMQQATPPPLSQPPSLVGLDSQLEAMRDILLVEDDALRTRGILVWGPAGCGKSALIQRLSREDKLDLLIVREDTELLQAFHAALSSKTKLMRQRRSVVVLENIHQLCKSRAFKSALISICDNAQFDPISIVATSNAPWTLDVNMLRHFENRISVPLPSAAQRTRILESYLCSQAMPCAEFASVGRQLDWHSSWDVITTAKRAALLAKKMGEPLARAHFTAAQQQQAPTFCKEMLPFFDAFANRFGAVSGGEQQQQQHMSMYS